MNKNIETAKEMFLHHKTGVLWGSNKKRIQSLEEIIAYLIAGVEELSKKG